jgi:hypothetical protein
MLSTTYILMLLIGHCHRRLVGVGGNMSKSVLANDFKFMCSIVNVDIGSIYHNGLSVAKELGDFLKRKSFRFRQEEKHEDSTEATDNYENLKRVKRCASEDSKTLTR